MFHHRGDRIRAVVQLCWLALQLIRVVETTTGDTRRTLRHELERVPLVNLATPDEQIAKRSALTPGDQTILTNLELPEPPRFFDFTPTVRRCFTGQTPDAPSVTLPHWLPSHGHRAEQCVGNLSAGDAAVATDVLVGAEVVDAPRPECVAVADVLQCH